MKTKLRHPVLLAVGTVLLLACSARAQILTTATVQGSGVLHAGESFSVEVLLDNSSGETLLGITYFLSVLTTAGNGEFSLTARDVTGSAFTFLTTSDSLALSSPGNLLDPVNAYDLGALDSSFTGIGNGFNFVVATLTVTSAGTVQPGTYSFQFFGDNAGTIPVQVTNTSFDSLDASSPSFSVTVVPEPGGCRLLFAACLLLWGRFLFSRSRGSGLPAF